MNAEPGSALVRPAARLIVIDPGDRILLMRWDRAPETAVDRAGSSSTGRIWFTPGGGLHPGETHEQAAVRELFEETGMPLPVGPCVWERQHTFTFHGQLIDQQERFFVVRAPDPTLCFDGWTDGEREDIGEVRWWTLEEIAASDETFAPRQLAGLLPPILRGELPDKPIVTGV